MKTKAALFTEPDKTFKVQEVELDEPKVGEVRVKMAYAGLCHSDWHVMDGDLPVGIAPMAMGHEGSGVVDAVGPGVTRIKQGDHVVLTFIPSCGKCKWCVSGQTMLCDLGAGILAGAQQDGTFRMHTADGKDVGQMCTISTFSEYTIANQDSVCVVDSSYPLDVACLVGCGVATGFGAAVHRAKVQPGSSALVIGVGGIGMNAVQGAKAAGATTIIAADINDGKLGWAKEFGATHTINPNKEDLVARVMEITNGEGVNYAFEAIATPETIGKAFDSTSKGGTTVVIGLSPATATAVPVNPLMLVLYQKALLGTFMEPPTRRSKFQNCLTCISTVRLCSMS